MLLAKMHVDLCVVKFRPNAQLIKVVGLEWNKIGLTQLQIKLDLSLFLIRNEFQKKLKKVEKNVPAQHLHFNVMIAFFLTI